MIYAENNLCLYNGFLLNYYTMQNTTEFINYLNKHNKILILGKGVFSHAINFEKYDLCIGIKQSIGILPRKDVLFLNDLEGLFGIEPYIKYIKYIVFPNAPHIASKPNKSIRNFYSLLSKQKFIFIKICLMLIY